MPTVTSKDGTSIAYERFGDGPPLILIGGALSTRQAGNELATKLSPHVNAYTVDRRGRGDSGDAHRYAVEREIEDIAALVDEAGGSAALFGTSSGAALALEATLRGVPVTRLALYEPPYLVDPGHPPVADDFDERLRAHVAAGRRGDAVEQFMREAVLVPEEVLAQMRESPGWTALLSVAHTLPYDQAVVGQVDLDDPDPLRRFAPIQVPTLAMDGGASPDWLRAPAMRLAEIMPNARHLTLEGQTHGIDAAVVTPVLVEFIAAG